MPVYEIDGIRPVIHPTAYVHPSAVLIGDVIVGPRCYVGPLASLRGDFGRLVLEEGANVQDTCVMHGFPEDDTVVEADGHIGHGAVLHGCRVGRNAMVGMNAVVMDKAVVGAESIVGAAARVVRPVTDEEIAWKSYGTRQYHDLNERSMRSMREVEALLEPEPDRRRMVFDEPHKPKKNT